VNLNAIEQHPSAMKDVDGTAAERSPYHNAATRNRTPGMDVKNSETQAVGLPSTGLAQKNFDAFFFTPRSFSREQAWKTCLMQPLSSLIAMGAVFVGTVERTTRSPAVHSFHH